MVRASPHQQKGPNPALIGAKVAVAQFSILTQLAAKGHQSLDSVSEARHLCRRRRWLAVAEEIHRRSG